MVSTAGPGGYAPIAIVGLGCRFPGAADPQAFWQLLAGGGSAIREVPADRWDAARLYDPDLADPGTMNTRWGGFLDHIDRFDAGFFGLSAGEARSLDPQQRLLLEVCWETLEAAGVPAERLAGTATGVYFGIGTSEYAATAFDDLDKVGAYFSVGNSPCMISNRVSNVLDLRGPSLAIDTGCSSSLVAVDAACRSLADGRIDYALAGGVSLIVSPRTSVGLSAAWMSAADGRCKSFDAAADGYVRGEGCGAVLLRRLDDALRGSDEILAVIAGSAVNQDGRGQGLTIPNPEALESVVRQALSSAGLLAGELSYVEGHGVGSALTDRLEALALSRVFAGVPAPRLGAVKTNIGHLESAAGIAGLLKVVLALRHGAIPATLNFETLHPDIAAQGFPFEIPTTLEPWLSDGARKAGVNAFGLGGTNSHVLLSEAPNSERPPAPGLDLDLLLLSAKSEAALRDLGAAYQALLDRADVRLGEVCRAAAYGRTHHQHRFAVPAGDVASVQCALQALADGRSTAVAVAPDGGPDLPIGASPEARAQAYLRGAIPQGAAASCASLPTYPFQRKRHWIDPAAVPGSSEPLATAEGRAGVTTLTADHPALLADHKINGSTVVSGPTQISMVLDRVLQTTTPVAALSIEGLALLLPLVLDGDAPRNLQVSLQSIGPSADAELRYDLGLSTGPNSTHATATVLVHQAPPPPRSSELAAARQRCSRPGSAEPLHASMTSRRIELGPSFRWMSAVASGEAEAVVDLRSPTAADGAGAWAVHPGRLDACFQSLFACLSPSEPTAYMLLGVERLTFYDLRPQPGCCHATLRHTGPTTFTGDVDVFDREGALVIGIEGLCFKRATPDALAKSAAAASPARAAPPAGAVGALAALVATTAAADKHLVIGEAIEAIVTDVAGLDQAKPLDGGAGFFDLGLDSLTSLELRNRLQTALGAAHPLPISVVFDHPTIDALGKHLLARLAPDTTPPAIVAAAPAPPSETIAIVSIACRFPGADSPEALWRLLSAGSDAITDLPAGRFDVDAYYDPDRAAPGKMYVRRGGFLDDIDQFDAGFFGITPREAASVDPQQRLLLEVTWQALERAGIAPDGLRDTQTGVFVGTCFDDYADRSLRSGDLSTVDAYTGTGSQACFAAGRIAYVLGLQGPALHVDTACSTSLVAMHLAAQSLRSGECALAIAGGANVIVSPQGTVNFSKLDALAPDGRCKTFDAAADGYVRGEGCGVVVLERLADAQRLGHPIVAVLRGSAVNHDGRSGGLTVPNGSAQVAVVQQALANAGVAGADIDYIEAHGTGTPLGDPVEVRALGEALGAERAHPRYIGSIKTNIGHLEPAAGVAGVIKTVLALGAGQIPPHLNLQTLNPQIDLDAVAAQIPSALVQWPERVNGPRLAGVSAFGMSGTNAHVILAEPPAGSDALAPDHRETPPRQRHVLTLSARSQAGLSALARSYADHLAARPDLDIGDVCFTANVGRTHFAHRLAFAAADLAALRASLLAVRVDTAEITRRPKVAFLFSGNGGQHGSLAPALYAQSPVFAEVIDRCDAALRNVLDVPLRSALHAGPADPRIDDPRYTQPAIYAVECALAALWRSWGVTPRAVLGHSVGELAAAHVAGVLSLEDGARLAAERGNLIAAGPTDGLMVAVRAGPAAVLPHLDPARICIAAINGRTDLVIAGDTAAMTSAIDALASQGIRTQRLSAGHSLPSPAIGPAVETFSRFAGTLEHHAPQRTWMSSVTGRPIETIETIDPAAYWRAHAAETVRFAAGAGALLDSAHDVFVELGPTPTLLGLVAQRLGDAPVTLCPSLRHAGDDWAQLLESLVVLYQRGVPVDWAGFDAPYQRRRVLLPTAPFERRRHWLERPAPPTVAPVSGVLGQRIRTPLADAAFQTQFSATQPRFVAEHQLHGRVLAPGTAYLAAALEAAGQVAPDRAVELADVRIDEALTVEPGSTRVVQLVLTRQDAGFRFVVSSADAGDVDDRWTRHAYGEIRDAALATAAPARRPSLAEGAIPAEAAYEALRARGLDYGDDFRRITKLWRSGPEAIAEVRGADEAGPIEPAVLDACLQVAVLAVIGEGDDDAGYSPIGFERVRITGSLVGPLLSQAVLRQARGEQTRTTDVRIHNADGAVVAEIEGLHIRRVSKQAFDAAATSHAAYEIAWRQAETPPNRLGRGGRWLVFSDGGDLAGALVERWQGDGRAVSTVRTGQRFETGDGGWCIDPFDPEHAEQLLAAHGAPAGVVFMWGLGGLGADEAIAGLLHTARALCRIAGGALFVVTAGCDGPEPTDVTHAALGGIADVLALENQQLSVSRVDVRSADLDGLCRELDGGAVEPRVALRDGGRQVARIARTTQPTTSAIVRQQATYLITGATGGLGAVTADVLADAGASHLVLVARRTETPEATAVAARLRSKGVQVVLHAADVADPAAVSSVFAAVAASMPPIRGVVHAAGVLDDGALANQTWQRAQRVLAPKVRGAWNLHRSSEGLELDFFVLFSSVAALCGSRGQASYAAANGYLDALAAVRRHNGLPATSINWGPWAEVGMAAQLAASGRLPAGLVATTPDQGAAALAAALSGSPRQVALLSVDWARFVRGWPSDRRRLVSELVRPEAAATTPSDLLARLQSAPAAGRRTILDAHVAAAAAAVMGLEPAAAPGPRQRLFDLGMDSLMAVELLNQLQADLGQPLPQTLIFEQPTLHALTDHLASDVLGLNAAPPPPPVASAPSIAGLDEDDVEALLMQKLDALDAEVDA